MIPNVMPPWSKLGRRIESQIRKAMHEEALVEGCEKLGVALSGGKDSLAMLYHLHAISGRGFPPYKLYAFHVSGAFSCGAGVDSSYLKAICAQLDIPLLIRDTEQTLDELECYSCSRKRRSLLFEMADEVGVDTVAFGHHRDDSIQTFLMNLLIKGEVEGNLPKVPLIKQGITIIRPLIYVTEADIRVFAEQQGFSRITCKCPVGINSARREVELLIQEMEQRFPNTRRNLAHAVRKYGSEKALGLG